jgi:hypothetical protein
VVLESLVVWALFVYISDIHKRRRLLKNKLKNKRCISICKIAQLNWLRRGSQTDFTYTLIPDASITIWLVTFCKVLARYHGYNGTYKNCIKSLLVTLTNKGRAFFVLTKFYAGSLAPINRRGSLHLYPIFFSYVATWLYLFYSLSYGVFYCSNSFWVSGEWRLHKIFPGRG